jgi:hypothetical protein
VALFGESSNFESTGGDAAMREQLIIRFPVRCPQCGKEHLEDLPLCEVADALVRDADISLVATCHEVIWAASKIEREQIRQYLAETLTRIVDL